MGLSFTIHGMNRRFRWRKCTNQPAMTGVNGFESQNVSEKGAIRIGIFAQQKNVRAIDQVHLLLEREVYAGDCRFSIIPA
jgi:hypothetical protein